MGRSHGYEGKLFGCIIALVPLHLSLYVLMHVVVIAGRLEYAVCSMHEMLAGTLIQACMRTDAQVYACPACIYADAWPQNIYVRSLTHAINLYVARS